MTDVDEDRFPSLAGYLRQLPDGIDSYASCVAKASLVRTVLHEWNGTAPASGLPESLAAMIADPPPPSSWVSEVAYVSTHYVIRDIEGMDDPTILELTYRANRRLTESRMYRVLAKVGSAGMLVRGASLSWRLLHRGVKLRVAVAKDRAKLIIRHPTGLWPAVAHQSAALGFRAVLEAAGASDISAELTVSRVDGAEFQLAWRERE